MLHDFDFQTRQIFFGNLLLVICCAFYLAWWLLAFKPVNPIKGMKTGWLLIPAFAAGVAAVVFAARGLGAVSANPGLFPSGWILWGGILAYVVLLAITRFLLHRPVTTELFLIVGWAMLALSEVSALLGGGAFSHGIAIRFVTIVVVSTVISLICYTLYYNLSAAAGFIDGMVPLLMSALVTAGIDLALLKG